MKIAVIKLMEGLLVKNNMTGQEYVTKAEKSLKVIAEKLEPYKRLSANIAIDLGELNKSFAAYSQFDNNEIIQNLRQAMEPYEMVKISSLSRDLLTDSLRSSVQELSKMVMLSQKLDVLESLKGITGAIDIISQKIEIEQLNQLQQIDFSVIFADIIPGTHSVSDAVETAYAMLENEMEEEYEENDRFTEKEIQEAFQEQITNPPKFQERVANWTEKKIKKYYIVFLLIAFLYSNFVQPYFQDNVGKPVMAYVVSNVKELPQKGAEVIGKMQKNIKAIITENTNYYYKVVFTDENGEIKEGYVAKRNLKFVEEESGDSDNTLPESKEADSQNE